MRLALGGGGLRKTEDSPVHLSHCSSLGSVTAFLLFFSIAWKAPSITAH